MATVTFDTMAFVEMLTAAGFDERQAKGLSKALKEVSKDDHLTTKEESKTDLAILRADIEITKRELKSDISSASLTMVKWLVALILGQTALMITILPKIMGH
jgi:hypothetical protein